MVFLIFALCLAGQIGCDTEDTSTYDVTISWSIGGLDICTTSLPENYGGGTLEFQKVEISIYDHESSPSPLREDIVSCAIHETVITNLPPGKYFVRLGAIATYNERELPYFQAKGHIRAGSLGSDTFQFPLELGTGKVNVKWGFEDGGQCGEYGVVTIAAKLISTGTRSKEYAHSDLPCNPEPGTASGDIFQEAEWDVYNVVVEGFDSEGMLTHRGVATEYLQVYPGEEIEIERILLEKI